METFTKPDEHGDCAPGVALDVARLAVPSGWEPIARLCSSVAGDADELITTIVRRVRAEIPAYGPRSAVTEQDLRRSVQENLEMMLHGTAQCRGPLPDELAVRSELGLRRAQQGLPIDALLEGFVIGYQALWTRLADDPLTSDPATQRLLLKAAVTIWEWTQAVTDSIRNAYHAEAERRAALVTGRRERLMDAILAGHLDDPELPAITAALGFDSAGFFTGVVADMLATSPVFADRVTSVLRASPGQTHAVARGSLLVAVSQKQPLEHVVQAILAERPTASIAIGLRRQGLQGARDSIADAKRTLPVARRDSQPRRFEDTWLTATLLASQHELRALLAPGLQACTRYPALADTVRVFAANGQSLSRAAHNLHVHLNTVAYRLSRWHDKTGWNPRTADGLAKSTAAIEIATTPADAPQPARASTPPSATAHRDR